MYRKTATHVFLWTLLLLSACGRTGGDAPAASTTLTLMTHDSFSISETVLAAFEVESGVRIALLPAGDAGTALNQAILARDAPLADVFFGVDNTFMGRALAADIFAPYASPRLADVPEAFKLDPTHRLTPVDYGDVCLNYDVDYFTTADLAPPARLADLVEPRYRGLLVVENPATSSPGLAFLLATVAAFGEDGPYTYLDFWRELRGNDVLVTNGWEDAYYGHFTVASDGDRPVVVSYATSPPAEVIFADPPRDRPPSASVTAAGSCFRQVEFAGILKGTPREAAAQKLVDYLLSVRVQEDIPLNMFVFPVNENAALPPEFVAWAGQVEDPVMLDPADIDANRNAWIEAWTDVVLR